MLDGQGAGGQQRCPEALASAPRPPAPAAVVARPALGIHPCSCCCDQGQDQQQGAAGGGHCGVFGAVVFLAAPGLPAACQALSAGFCST
jgi:hypothetical protein